MKIPIPAASWIHSTQFFPTVGFQHIFSTYLSTYVDKDESSFKTIKRGYQICGPTDSLRWEQLSLIKLIYFW